MTDEELERLARAATPHEEEWGSRIAPSCFEPRHQQFIAAFNPAAALALLERVRKAEDQLAHIAATLEYEGPADGVADAVKRYHEASVDICVKAINERKAAEAALLCEHGAEREYCAASHNAAVDAARRRALESAMLLAAGVEREEGEQGRMGPASGAGEVKDRIKDRIRWLDEGTE